MWTFILIQGLKEKPNCASVPGSEVTTPVVKKWDLYSSLLLLRLCHCDLSPINKAWNLVKIRLLNLVEGDFFWCGERKGSKKHNFSVSITEKVLMRVCYRFIWANSGSETDRFWPTTAAEIIAERRRVEKSKIAVFPPLWQYRLCLQRNMIS